MPQAAYDFFGNGQRLLSFAWRLTVDTGRNVLANTLRQLLGLRVGENLGTREHRPGCRFADRLAQRNAGAKWSARGSMSITLVERQTLVEQRLPAWTEMTTQSITRRRDLCR
jgi:hypothetical protein